MPPKRKRTKVDVEPELPRKRRTTRSSGILKEGGIDDTFQSRRPGQSRPIPVKRGKAVNGHVPTFGESRAETPNGGDDDDELLLSPSKSRPASTACLYAQKRAILRALQEPPDPYASDDDMDDREPGANKIALKQLCELLKGTVIRGEGNSCLILGPRGSGKSQLIEHCLAALDEPPITLRLSGWVQNNDRLAMREIAYQLTQQTGASLLSKVEQDDSCADGDDNPFIENGVAISLPPSSHLPQLISVLPTLSRSTVVILDGFDLFALHPRQSLLYCLLDTVQSCRSVRGNRGIAVIGVTSRVDTINLLEKRVKSRFSGRILWTAPPSQFENWVRIARNALSTPIDDDNNLEWSNTWKASVDKFLSDSGVLDMLKETYALTRDLRTLSRILVTPILGVEPSSPYLSPSSLSSAVAVQRFRPRFPYLCTETYPSICLLIAAMHLRTAGQDIVTFEMLYECFRDQVRSSTSAPVQVEGGGIGMVRCSREVLMTAFEHLESTRAFVHVTAASQCIAKEFVRYRCVVEKEEVKKAVEKMGQTNLKKWLTKAQ